MRFHKTVIAGAVTLALGMGAVSAVPATASPVNSDDDAIQTQLHIRKSYHEATLTYMNPKSVAGKLENQVGVIGWADGRVVAPIAKSTTESSPEDGVTVLEHTDPRREVTMKRTFTVKGDEINVVTELTNNAGTARELAIRMYNHAKPMKGTMTAAQFGDSLRGEDKSAYRVDANFPGATALATAQDPATLPEWNAGSDNKNMERGEVLSGTWVQTVEPGATMKAEMTVKIETQLGALDSDGDGLLDIWEMQGANVNGVDMPLHRWGANPYEKDIFLQMNWMKSEWETEGCQEAARFAVNPEGFARYDACSKMNTNVYRPSGLILDQLVKKFAAHGYNLHIDAGKGYSKNFEARDDEYRGGPILGYKDHYFNSPETSGSELITTSVDLLKEREGIFRSGVIGDLMDAPSANGSINYATGRALIGGTSFYVSKNARMGAEDKVRNTIMHELGHNLGLNHNGMLWVDGKRQSVYEWTKYGDWLSDRPSAMNYAYQFVTFDYQEEDKSGNQEAPHPGCAGAPDCYVGEWSVPSEWKNLNVKAGGIGDVSVKPAESDSESDKDAEKRRGIERDARELDAAAALKNDGKADFYMADENSIATVRTDNKVVGTIGNRGYHDHEFTVRAFYGKELSRITPVQTIKVKGIGDAKEAGPQSRKEIQIPIPDTQRLYGSYVPVYIQIENESGEIVFSELFDISLLDYTEDELRQVSTQLGDSVLGQRASALLSQGKLGDFQDTNRRNLADTKELKQPKRPSTPPTTSAKPSPSAAPSTAAPADPTTQDAKATDDKGGVDEKTRNTILIVVGVLLGILGLGGAAAAVMANK